MPQAVITLPIADESLWSNECRRRATLASMGITPLISRADSVGATPANRFLAPIPKDSVATDQEGEAAMGGEQVRALLRGTQDASTPEMAESLDKRQLSAASQQSIMDKESRLGTEPLSLVMVTSADILWIEVLEDQLLRKEQLQLVAAMARAVRGTNVHCAHQQFDWPPAHQSALSSAKGGMSDMLKGFIQRLIRDRATQQMVLMGPCDCLPDTGLPLLEIPSSVSMLRDGSLKQQAWDVLKPLRARA